MLISNEPIKVADLKNLVNKVMLNSALVIEIINKSLSESKKNFDEARNVLIIKSLKKLF